MKTGIERIEAERLRQIQVKGWTPEHDDRHSRGELRYAAQAYEETADAQIRGERPRDMHPRWPWEREWWKPETAARNLEKAGALYLAEAARSSRCDQPSAESYLAEMNSAALRCRDKIDRLVSGVQLSQDELFEAIGLLMARIEACGASADLTAAVCLAGDIRQAVGNRWNPSDAHAADRVRQLIPDVLDTSTASDSRLDELGKDLLVQQAMEIFKGGNHEQQLHSLRSEPANRDGSAL